jgi:hypothetical protein
MLYKQSLPAWAILDASSERNGINADIIFEVEMVYTYRLEPQQWCAYSLPSF